MSRNFARREHSDLESVALEQSRVTRATHSLQSIPLQMDHQSDALATSTLYYAMNALNASASILFWYSESGQLECFSCINFEPARMQQYQEHVTLCDPFSPQALYRARRNISMQNCVFLDECSNMGGAYLHFRESCGLADELNLLFWQDANPVAGLSVLRRPGDPSFLSETRDWEAARKFFESSLSFHWRARSRHLNYVLKDQLKIKPREMEVLSAICSGASNADIADLLGISVATVKCHIVSIFMKLGVDNRSSIVSKVNSLQFL